MSIERRTQAPIWLRLLNWLAERDTAYRQSRHVKALSAARLKDVGMSRQDADAAFYHGWASRNGTDGRQLPRRPSYSR